MTVPAYELNPHGVYSSTPWTGFCYNWLGARVRVRVFGRWREGTVEGVDDLHHALTASLKDGSKRVQVTAPYQAFRRIGA